MKFKALICISLNPIDLIFFKQEQQLRYGNTRKYMTPLLTIQFTFFVATNRNGTICKTLSLLLMTWHCCCSFSILYNSAHLVIHFAL